MQQHPLIIKTAKGQRFSGNPLHSWVDQTSRVTSPFHPPYPEPLQPPTNTVTDFEKSIRSARGE